MSYNYPKTEGKTPSSGLGILCNGDILIKLSYSSLLSEQPKSDVHACPTVYLNQYLKAG